MIPRPILHRTALVTLLAASAAAQCNDPQPPRGGFEIMLDRDRLVSFSDGYKTRANAIFPAGTPGPCKWPLVVLVHGLGGARTDNFFEARRLAEAGYFVVSYDVRGQGTGPVLNPNKGSRLWALDEWIDLAEIVEWAGNLYSRRIDLGRVAVFGDSQGGAHAWAAAAYSGRALPANPRRRTPFPPIACVVPRYFAPSLVDVVAPQGAAFHWHVPALGLAAFGPGVLLEPSYKAQIAKFLDADDPAGLAAWLRTVPGKDFRAELLQTKVPIFAILGWQDSWTDNLEVVELCRRLKTAPMRIYLSTGLHGTPSNRYQSSRQMVLTEAWLRRHLKGAPERAELGPPFLSATIPADFAEYSNATSLWRHSADSQWPPADTKPLRLYLRQRGALTEEKPGASEPADTVRHVVAPGYDARDYHRELGKVEDVTKSIPLSDHAYDSAPLQTDTALTGTPELELELVPDHPRFQLSARLLAVSQSNASHVLTTGAAAVNQTSGPRRERITIELAPVSAVVPAGYRLRLQVRNHHLVQPLDVDSFGRVPLFHSYAVRVEHGSSVLSWIDLPVREFVPVDLATHVTSLSLSAPPATTLELRSEPGWKDGVYIVFVSLSGQGPAQQLPTGSELWLTPDVATRSFMAAINRPVMVNFAGLLDAQGNASCTLDLGLLAPLPSFLLGTSLHVAPVVYHPARDWHAGPPVRLMFR